MSHIEEFWWNWGVQAAVAIATLVVAFIAIFGEWIRSKLFHPKLKLTLLNPLGELTNISLTAPDGTTRVEKCRMFHVRVSNEARWPQATHVQILLLRLEEVGPDGQLQIKWTGEVPMRWVLQEIHPLLRTVGREAVCDLLTVIKDKWLELNPLMTPNNLPSRRTEPTNMVVTLQARSNEGDSRVLRLRIAWNGAWMDGAQEMAQYLKVTEERN
jgi:hypothetical protein